MTARSTQLFLLALTAACFHETHGAHEQAAAPAALTVVDALGARYDALAAPRDPELLLRFDAPPLSPESTLWLVPDRLSDAAAARLVAGRVPAGFVERARELDVIADANTLRARPRAPLAADTSYTLLWLARARPAVFALKTSASPRLGARLAASWPGHTEANVPTNLARVLLRFDGELAESSASVELSSAQGAAPVAVSFAACAELGLAPGTCITVTPSASLSANTPYQLRAAPLHSATGAELAPIALAFTTGEEDRTPPLLRPLACASDEVAREGMCLLTNDEGTSLRGMIDGSGMIALIAPPTIGATLSFGDQFELVGAPRAQATNAVVRIVDLAGNARELPLSIEPPPPLTPLAIDELRSDPLGREPAQEYIELLNSGADAIAMTGLTLTTDAAQRGRAVLGELRLAPRERVLVVGPDFDPRDGADGELPSGVRLVRLEGALALTNAGGVVIARDAQGRRLSEAHYGAPLWAGQCHARPASAGRRARLALDPEGDCTPGAATFDER